MKTVLITGGACGIGRATALLAADRGWSVAINYLSGEEAAIATARDVERRGGRAMLVRGDVGREADVIQVFDRTLDAFGALDGVVVNAGIIASALPLAEMSVDRLLRVFETNTLGACLCARQAARVLPFDRGGRGGSIVLVSSTAARLGSPFEFVDYAGSKAALDTLALGLAKELGAQGVRVNAIRPGMIETDIHASSGEPDRALRLGRSAPLGRTGRPEEIAEAIVWLLSDAASYTTGAVLDVAGGR